MPTNIPSSTGHGWNPASLLEHHADRFPDRRCLAFDGRPRTYAELCEGVRSLAAGLLRGGLRAGDVVGVLAFNSDAFIELMYAVSYVGAIFMPINYRLAPEEVRYLLEHSGARAFVSEDELMRLAVPACGGMPDLRRLSLDDSLDRGEGWTHLEELRDGGERPSMASVGPDDVQRLMYTSGTTSRPKGVMISYANVAWKNACHTVELAMTPDDIGLVAGPLYHVGALDLTATTLLHAGGAVVVQRSFDPAAVVSAIERERVTNVWLAPAMVSQLVRVPGIEDRDLSSVRLIIDGGEKMPLPLIKRVLEVFPSAWFADAYGLTETVGGDTFLDKGRCLEKLGSVGKPCPYIELQIWDENDNAIPVGAEGEIVLRGPKVFQGYWRDDVATMDAFRGGWFHTGDIGRLDDDGFLFVVDRKKDVIVSGGENIASPEVERVLYEHPSVLEAAVVAKPDEKWGEVPAAFVVAAEGASLDQMDLVKHCRDRLASFKCPKHVEFLDALPRNPSGKVLKRELRERVLRAGGLAGGGPDGVEDRPMTS
ncbi:MAG: long-chain-fatty-acid--CoA ligase [Streptosporangiales bacterium]|nr:long-chain-fatty-acid--CoA ligase [Streptosporangiales bacterium]